MKYAFTMIELIFVIVIIGILAAVAIPKVNSISISAKQSNLESFISTLNTTVGPTMWKKSLNDATQGEVANATFCGNLVPLYLNELPAELTSFPNTCIPLVKTEVASSGVITFNEGTTISSPYWVIDRNKYK